MLLMMLELLAVGFIVGVCITAVVLAVITGVDALLRVRHARDARPVADVHPLGRRAATGPVPAGRSGPGHPRAA